MSELPPGFVLDQPSPAQAPELPAGFVLDGTPQAAEATAKKPFGWGDTWPAKLAKQAYAAVTLPGDVHQGNTSITGENGRTSPEVIQRSADLAMLAIPINPAVRAGDRVITGAVRGTQETGAPTREALKRSSSEAYQSPEVQGLQVRPAALERLSQEAQSALNVKGVDENLAPKTFGVLRSASNVPEGAVGVTGGNLESLRRTLGTAAGSSDPTERMAAKHAMAALDDFISKMPIEDILAGDAAAAAAKWGQGRGDYGAFMRSGMIGKSVEKAERQAGRTGSGSNLENALRQKISSIRDSESKIRGFSQEETAAMDRIIEGTTLRNAARLVGKAAPTGSVSAMLSLGAVAGAGPAGLALPIAGGIGKFLAEKLTQRDISKLDALVRSRSPLAKAVQSSSSKWSQAADALAGEPSAAKLATFLMASRNFSNTLGAAGVPMPVKDLIRNLQAPMHTPAQDDQIEP